MGIALLAVISLAAVQAAGAAAEGGSWTGLYPAGRVDAPAGGVHWIYRSDELVPAGDGPVSLTGAVELSNWRLVDVVWDNGIERKAAIPGDAIPSEVPFFLECRVEYRGAAALDDEALELTRPLFWLARAEGARAAPEIPQPSWFRRLFGAMPPVRLERGDGPPRNLLMLMVDTLRPDATAPYGHEYVLTPHMDLLAQTGVTFVNSWGASSSTRPSVGSMFTGLYPPAHGAVRHAVNGAALHEGVPRLAEALAARGLETIGISANAQVTKAYGFAKGFAHYDCPVFESQVSERAAETLRRVDEPFFLYLHYMGPHQPYEPPEDYAPVYAGRSLYPELDLYLAEVTLEDRRLGEVLLELVRQGLHERTLVWLLSDHGEEFWEHGWNGHGAHLYEEAVRTVSVLTDFGGNRTVSRPLLPPVTHVDVFPTLADLMDFPPPPVAQGLNLAPVVRGEPGTRRNRTLFLHHGGGLEDAPHESDKQAVLQPPWKFILWTQKGDRELYNLDKDPGETENLAEAAPERAAAMEAELRDHLERCGSIAAPFMEGGGTAGPSPEDLKNMEAYGYLD